MCETAANMPVGKVPGTDVCTLTLTISMGHSAASAKTSAEAEPTSQMILRYSVAACSPAKLA